MPTPAAAAVIVHLEAERAKALSRLVELLSIPSISTDPAYAAQTRAAGQLLTDRLAAAGFAAELVDCERFAAGGHPIVLAHHAGPPGAPTLLYYGHYDVQPPDPLELWESPPFQPTLVEGPHGPRIVARGAVDDKGQVSTFVEALCAWKAVHGGLPVNVTVLVEGEEESGSRSLPGFLAAYRDRLRADACIVTDTNSWTIDVPAITTRLRGIIHAEVTLIGPSRDLHSGMYGGAVPNVLHALAKVIAELHDAYGRVAIPGFYDDVRALTDAERTAWAALGFDAAGYLAEVGLDRSVGEMGFSELERMWARPTCDVNGLWGGYTGAGAKTVIAAEAHAKLTCRLVGDQDPARIGAGLRRFFTERTPPGCRWQLDISAGSRAITVPPDSPFVRAAAAGLADVYGRAPVLSGIGGSIPVVGMIQDILGFDSVLVGFGLADDRIHSPNEKFELRCFENGMKSHAAILGRLAEAGR